MKFEVFTEMEYTANTAGTLILNVHALRSPNQTIIKESFDIEPYIKVEELLTIQSETGWYVSKYLNREILS